MLPMLDLHVSAWKDRTRLRRPKLKMPEFNDIVKRSSNVTCDALVVCILISCNVKRKLGMGT